MDLEQISEIYTAFGDFCHTCPFPILSSEIRRDVDQERMIAKVDFVIWYDKVVKEKLFIDLKNIGSPVSHDQWVILFQNEFFKILNDAVNAKI